MSVSTFSYLRNADDAQRPANKTSAYSDVWPPPRNESLFVLVLFAAPLTLSCQIQLSQILRRPTLLRLFDHA
ncbi:uncharacterized protein PgNI_03057 [Pyricularia grisea]|uniref:Uncharacterized protein n=1 Tax=Pyricularia grisea TaxID=148305 RepID=A0A6P8B8K5_PYRGI|nr:uncharacterized protein PgNI_03057 [Pyricularia grisea]TLD12121.1 hypothetical protein PgNI_03057 [Pyricularia grisea]